MGFQWLAAEIAKTAATTTGAGARAAAEAAGQEVGMAATIANALRSIGASLGMTFAGVSANQAPLIGPAAPAEAAAVTAAVDAAAMGFLVADTGAWRVDRDRLVFAHEGEMIVPSRGGIASEFRDVLSGGGQAAPSGDTHNHTWNIHTYGPNDMLAALTNIRHPLGRLISETFKNTPSLRPST
jgi:hypothetical protein